MHHGGSLLIRAAVTIVAILCSFASPARACLWDSDTLRDERIGMPGIAEVLAGRFERHSAFFYEERIKRSLATIEREPTNLAAWDDLAVAYDKLGQYDRAIETIERKAAIEPGEYTTESNWGTFLVHRGDYEAGLAHLRRALEINLDAHFGRERYQVMAVEYLLAAKADPTVFERGSFAWPIVTAEANVTTRPTTSPEDERDQRESDLRRVLANGSRPKARPDVDAAITGVVGMLRFGPGTSPHLYAALGDLLLARGDLNLAYRAFKRARDAGHPSPTWVDERLEISGGRIARRADIDDATIAKERAAADAWVSAYQLFEDDLVRRGATIDDAALAPFYARHGSARERIGLMSPSEFGHKMKRSPETMIPVVLVATLGAWIAIRMAFRYCARRSKMRAA